MAVPARLLDVEEGDAALGGSRRGRVLLAGAPSDVALDCVPEARPGDHVLVHLGCALCVLSPAEAAARLALLEELAALLD